MQARAVLKQANDALKGAATGAKQARHGRASLETPAFAHADGSVAVPSCANQKLECVWGPGRGSLLHKIALRVLPLCV